MNDALRVLVVGGLDRLERSFEVLGRELGFAIEAHTGDVRGRGARELESKVGRADFVVVLTSVVSHGGMLLAKKHARAANKKLHIVRGGAVAAVRGLLVATRAQGGATRIATHAA